MSTDLLSIFKPHENSLAMAVKDYQDQLQDLLEQHFEEVTTEWRTRMQKAVYSPRVDVAVGPFAIEDGVTYTHEHNKLFEKHKSLFTRLVKQHLRNIEAIGDKMSEEAKQMINQKMSDLYYTNFNGRCFLAIEVENKSSRKHLMGGAVNATVLGKIGIAVGYDEGKHKAFLNLYRYFEFLRQVEKPTFNANNLLIISKDQLVEILSK